MNLIAVVSSQPKSIEKSKKTFDSIKKQSLKPDKIYWFYPYKSKRFGCDYPEVPKWTKEYDNLEVVRCTDYGPATKIIPLLDIDIPEDTKIVIFDDDTYYPYNSIELLNDNFKDNLGLGFSGSLREYIPSGVFTSETAFKTKKISWKNKVNILLCSHMVMYPRKMYPKNSEEYINDMKNIKGSFLNDDMMNSYYAQKNNIKLYTIYNKEFNKHFKHIQVEGMLTGTNKPLETYLDLIIRHKGRVPISVTIIILLILAIFLVVLKKILYYTKL